MLTIEETSFTKRFSKTATLRHFFVSKENKIGFDSNILKKNVRLCKKTMKGENMSDVQGSLLGNAVLRREDPDLLIGAEKYFDDIEVQGLGLSLIHI